MYQDCCGGKTVFVTQQHSPLLPPCLYLFFKLTFFLSLFFPSTQWSKDDSVNNCFNETKHILHTGHIYIFLISTQMVARQQLHGIAS